MMFSSDIVRRLSMLVPANINLIGRRILQGSLPVSTVSYARRSLTYTPNLRATKWFYAVRKGRVPGIYATWDEAKEQVNGFSGAQFTKFASREAAAAFVEGEVLLGAVSSPERLVVYTDGSHSATGEGGFGAYFAADPTPDLHGRVPSFAVTGEPIEPGSNNKSELYAVLRVLEVDPDPARELHFYCDSQYVVEAFNGRDGAPPSRRGNIKNRDIILYIQELIDYRSKAVKFYWVKGHASIPGNVAADKLAAAGSTRSEVPSRDFRAELKALRSMAKASEKPKRPSTKKAKEVSKT